MTATRLAAYSALAVSPVAGAAIYSGIGLTVGPNETQSLSRSGGGVFISLDLSMSRWTHYSASDWGGSGTLSSRWSTQWNVGFPGSGIYPIAWGVSFHGRLDAGDSAAAGQSSWTGSVPLNVRAGTRLASWYPGGGYDTIWSNQDGQWPVEDGRGYLGFSFYHDLSGGDVMHYGWLDVEVSEDALTVHAWAYGDGDQMVLAGEEAAVPAPGALGLLTLAAGAAGVRRRRRAG